MGIVQDIGHILLPVDDMEKALAFYRDLLGFRVVGKGSPVWTVVETTPRLPRPVEVAPAGLPKRRIEPGDEPRREALLLHRFSEVRRDRLDVPREDPHLAPVVDFALADETVDPLAIPIQGAV